MRSVTLVGFAEIEEDPLSSLALATANASAGPNVRAVTAKLFLSAEMKEAPPIRKRPAPKATIPGLHPQTAQRVHAFPSRFREVEAHPAGHGDEPRKFVRNHRCVLSYVLPIKRSLI